MDFEVIPASFRALRDRGMDYVLVEAVGMTVHGIVRATRDADVFVRPEECNVARLRKALHCAPFSGLPLLLRLRGKLPWECTSSGAWRKPKTERKPGNATRATGPNHNILDKI